MTFRFAPPGSITSKGLTQEEIARAMKVSRAKVIRLLAAARDSGIVRIRIDAKGSEQLALERRLVRDCGLREAVVTPSPTGDSADCGGGRPGGGHVHR